MEDAINFIPSPTRLFNVLMISPAPPHWQLIGSEFALIPLYALLATTDPSVPPENYVTPLNPPIPTPPPPPPPPPPPLLR